MRRTPESNPHAVIHPESFATLSHDRGVGKALPCSTADFGRTVVRSGRVERKPARTARSAMMDSSMTFCDGVGIV